MWGRRGGSFPCMWLSSSAPLPWQSSLPSSAFPAVDFLPPVPSVRLPTANSSSRSRPVLQSPRSSSQPPCTPMNTHPNPGHVELWYGPSVYFSLCPICHRLATSPSSDVLMLPFCPNLFCCQRGVFPIREQVSPNSGISPLLQLPCCGVPVPSCFLSSSFSLFFIILPSYAGMFIVLSGVQSLLLVFSWCSVRTVASIDVFLMHPWREMNSTSSYSSAILTPLSIFYFKLNEL